MSTTHVHVMFCTSAPQWQIARLWIWEQQFRRTRIRQRPSWWCTHYQGLMLPQQLTMWVNSWQWNNNQPRQCVHLLVTLKPILIKYAAQQCGYETSACKGAICMCSLIDSTVFCVCEAGSSGLKPLNKRSCRKWGRSLIINKAFKYNRHP